MKRIFAAVITLLLLTGTAFAADIKMDSDDLALDTAAFNEITAVEAAAPEIPAPSAILMEKETGTVIYEKNAKDRLRPASVTKVMTILLIAEAIDSGEIGFDDIVTTSTYASSMGGSQIFLKEGETMTVRDMLKAIVVSSANDAAVAMAEHLCGSESAFTDKMNSRAQELGMVNTTFLNCTGLLDQPEHLTTAEDIAIMSRELIKHDWIKEYTTIWMDTVRGGEFGLSNTNKLIYYYSGATGLKTGFTSSAGYCLSATAMRDGVEYIAVVMNCETSQDRFESAKALLSYAFATYTLTDAAPEEELCPVPVEMGKELQVIPILSGGEKILVEKSGLAALKKTAELEEGLKAPVKKGQVIGKLTVSDDSESVYECDIVSDRDVEKLGVLEIYLNLLSYIFRGCAPYGNI